MAGAAPWVRDATDDFADMNATVARHVERDWSVSPRGAGSGGVSFVSGPDRALTVGIGYG